jgi:hypothetical protein
MPLARAATTRPRRGEFRVYVMRLARDYLKCPGHLANGIGTLGGGRRSIEHGAGSQIKDRAMARTGDLVAAYLAVA